MKIIKSEMRTKALREGKKSVSLATNHIMRTYLISYSDCLRPPIKLKYLNHVNITNTVIFYSR